MILEKGKWYVRYDEGKIDTIWCINHNSISSHYDWIEIEPLVIVEKHPIQMEVDEKMAALKAKFKRLCAEAESKEQEMKTKLGVDDLIDILEKQIEVLKERAQEHGAFDVFDRAATISKDNNGKSTVVDVMAAVKMARLEANPFNYDSLVDYLNYRAIETIFIVNGLRDVHDYKKAEIKNNAPGGDHGSI